MGCMEIRKANGVTSASGRTAKLDKARARSNRSAKHTNARSYYKNHGTGQCDSAQMAKLDDSKTWASDADDSAMISLGFPEHWKSAEQKAATPKDSPLDQFFTNSESDEQAMPSIDMNNARTGANTHAGFMSESERSDGARARTIGRKGLGDILRPAPKIPLGAKCVSFNDSDSRQMIYNSATNCMNKANCPWADGSHPSMQASEA